MNTKLHFSLKISMCLNTNSLSSFIQIAHQIAFFKFVNDCNVMQCVETINRYRINIGLFLWIFYIARTIIDLQQYKHLLAVCVLFWITTV